MAQSRKDNVVKWYIIHGWCTKLLRINHYLKIWGVGSLELGKTKLLDKGRVEE